MLFDINASITKQNLQKQVILNLLSEIALQPITESPEQRDDLQEKLIQFIYEKPFDSLYGGLVVQQKSHDESAFVYLKPKEINRSLSEIFTKADQVLYHGLFSYIAKQIDDYLAGVELGILGSKELPACLNLDELNNALDDKERQLLNALVPHNKLQIQKECLFISYSRSLEDAALVVNMHYKEAQIVEFSIQNKLKSCF
jgi:hypothetical protein